MKPACKIKRNSERKEKKTGAFDSELKTDWLWIHFSWHTKHEGLCCCNRTEATRFKKKKTKTREQIKRNENTIYATQNVAEYCR